ncbi:hypothetical protein RFG22_08855 [Streptococcus ruminantium]|uniref:hypothetical protein n=1 Tax=Streptococcus ruminantium TaxID=1917441 RepID=UPI00280E8C4E|nr:hypothetical protein [Streptococcus ruminantium]MDQ8759989.1 hypothetical protein [Streptococcus ruminantium]MDQ8765317.1 hypothetical protein [Streptococcus ruminantium]MDQ8767796.1 hypothetical protein [Streptococcus ruminantium]MDQ8780685.1 hypothetical protein [Streptococcus ruminantium]MDQ8794518.1 hypothetical protein [Streptococcus ruminantium]
MKKIVQNGLFLQSVADESLLFFVCNPKGRQSHVVRATVEDETPNLSDGGRACFRGVEEGTRGRKQGQLG